jgi:multicomponent Na+:H+ antiporter subunit G
VTLMSLIIIISGVVFILLGVLGILRLPDFYTRLHAMGKCDTLGVGLLLIGLALYQGVSFASMKLLLISLFISLANPTATHAIGRAALRTGLMPWASDKEGA